jgi:hypothetical protein
LGEVIRPRQWKIGVTKDVKVAVTGRRRLRQHWRVGRGFDYVFVNDHTFRTLFVSERRFDLGILLKSD